MTCSAGSSRPPVDANAMPWRKTTTACYCPLLPCTKIVLTSSPRTYYFPSARGTSRSRRGLVVVLETHHRHGRKILRSHPAGRRSKPVCIWRFPSRCTSASRGTVPARDTRKLEWRRGSPPPWRRAAEVWHIRVPAAGSDPNLARPRQPARERKATCGIDVGSGAGTGTEYTAMHSRLFPHRTYGSESASLVSRGDDASSSLKTPTSHSQSPLSYEQLSSIIAQRSDAPKVTL